MRLMIWVKDGALRFFSAPLYEEEELSDELLRARRLAPAALTRAAGGARRGERLFPCIASTETIQAPERAHMFGME